MIHRGACKDCTFWQQSFADTGECRKKPPTLHAVTAMDDEGNPYTEMQTLFPEVQGDEWCGQYKYTFELFVKLQPGG